MSKLINVGNCPICKNKIWIDKVKCQQDGTASWKLGFTVKDKICYEFLAQIGNDRMFYKCPECKEEIAQDEEELLNIFRED
jgi:uncharacterized protein YbaR (Trm112 family)